MVIHTQQRCWMQILLHYPQYCEYLFLEKCRTKILKEHVDTVWIN